MFKIGLIAVFIALSVVSGPLAARAQINPSSEQRSALLIEIQHLLTEVLRLQVLLKEIQPSVRVPVAFPSQPYKSIYFDRVYEAIYFQSNVALLNSNLGSGVREEDQSMFNLLRIVVGDKLVKDKLEEWRVFYADREDLGAFVELNPVSGRWIMGVNRDGYVADKENRRESFSRLFLHEFAHIFLFENESFTKTYESRFWTKTDSAHQKKAEQVLDKDRFDLLVNYYDQNKDRFVSDYATLSPNEDMAETFVSFIMEERPEGNTIKEQKILNFYKELEFTNFRNMVRINLKATGIKI